MKCAIVALLSTSAVNLGDPHPETHAACPLPALHTTDTFACQPSYPIMPNPAHQHHKSTLIHAYPHLDPPASVAISV
jgi:hypothetical protein